MPRSPNAPAVFESLHPSVPAAFLLGTLGVSMLAVQPVYLVFSLAGGLFCSLLCRGARETLWALRWQLPLLLLLCLLNPLFSASGSTLLFRLAGRGVYLESLAFGACMGALLLSTLLWLGCADVLLGPDAFLDLSGRGLPVVALMASMTLRLVPQLMGRAREVEATLDACSAAGEARGTGGLRGRAARLNGVLLSWSLEDSLERAAAMRARGWGARERRSSYRPHPLRPSDAPGLALVVALLLLNALLAWVAAGQWRFYPSMPTLLPWWGYVPWALQLLLPSLLVLRDRLIWWRLP
ncbi:energy-coupling factor transporter transmembrane component T [Olsenella urininfantis]|uniref:energy-coupling factor transporter transmembrane component T n=1 Tax=Olsenella urininfantis TaxID=1871033 RepID=UPI0009869758|nr:energy-coupling factor transporter transmembrane component T [Olsenella urininfantis]